MTAEEIKGAISQLQVAITALSGDSALSGEIAWRFSDRLPLWEIAYQLAVLNEREEEKREWEIEDREKAELQ